MGRSTAFLAQRSTAIATTQEEQGAKRIAGAPQRDARATIVILIRALLGLKGFSVSEVERRLKGWKESKCRTGFFEFPLPCAEFCGIVWRHLLFKDWSQPWNEDIAKLMFIKHPDSIHLTVALVVFTISCTSIQAYETFTKDILLCMFISNELLF